MCSATRGFLVVLLAVICSTAWTVAARAERPLTLGIVDPALQDPDTAPTWLPKARVSGATALRLTVTWAAIAQREPADGSNPSDPAYEWEATDASVRLAVAAGMTPTLSANAAPSWAEGRNRPASAAAGSWRPDARAFGLFGQALARRYSGTYPDPQRAGSALPRIRFFQAWNEPNLSLYLAPQYRASGIQKVPASPTIYRDLLNAFYTGVKRADPSNVVVTAGTAPYGDYPAGGSRMPPAVFVRALFCLNAKLEQICRATSRFDVLDHHPYGIGGPRRRALNVGDVALPDLAKLVRPLRAAVRLGTALPRRAKRVWVTEVSWDSSPPDPDGVPEDTRVRWLQDGLFVLWSAGVDTISWFLIRDQAPVPSYGATYQSGLYLRDGTAKPAQRAYRFPFTLVAKGANTARAWCRSPEAGSLRIQRRTASGWVTVATRDVSVGEVFSERIRIVRGQEARATVGNSASLPWKAT
jgi:hypothetical protein